MLHVAIATRAFRRYSTYTTATLAGIFTNSVFGVIYSFAYLALWARTGTPAGTTPPTPSPTSGSARPC
jgi:ABC-2 type transport system permease protein